MELLNVMKNLTLQECNCDEEMNFFKSIAADIDNVPTDVVLVEYADKTMILLSQYQKLGCMLMVLKDQIHNPSGIDDIYTIKVIFGASEAEQIAAARYLAEAIQITKPLVLFINLKSLDIETLKACKDIILDMKSEESN